MPHKDDSCLRKSLTTDFNSDQVFFLEGWLFVLHASIVGDFIDFSVVVLSLIERNIT